jgi:hypothetical protein
LQRNTAMEVLQVTDRLKTTWSYLRNSSK